MKPVATLKKALEAMRAALNKTGDPVVLMRGDPEPEDADTPVIIVDFVSTTPFGYETETSTSIQVSSYAGTKAAALGYAEKAGEALKAAGLREGQTVNAPDEVGTITEWRL